MVQELTGARLRSLVDYDETTGLFTWKVRNARAPAGSIAKSMDGKGYLRINIDCKNYSQHHLAWFYVYGIWPTGCIDHIDRNKLNNAISNLRDVSLSENQWNRNKGISKRTGLPTGVTIEKRTGKYVARIGVNWRTVYLGTFDTPEEAKVAWDTADKERSLNVKR